MSEDRLAEVDPLAMNLIVANGIPSLSGLDITRYQDIVNTWVTDFQHRCLPQWEPYFHDAPHYFENDIRYFRLGMVCQYLELEVGIQYNLDQRDLTGILYTNPSDLFLNGVIDSREGTCGNMAALQVAFGWRMGWPVSLACVNSHFILRFDDGNATYNIEATQSGHGGFKSDPDEFLIETKKLPPIAILSGSDLRALRPHEMLGSFVGLRARHFQDIGKHEGNEHKMLGSEPDWLLARQLFPSSRVLYKNQVVVSSMRGDSLFEPYEAGHPNSYAQCLDEIRFCRFNQWQIDDRGPEHDSCKPSHQAIDDLFTTLEIKQ
ncbi:transglutaminase family protein [Pirellulaceae bacterium SH501]